MFTATFVLFYVAVFCVASLVLLAADIATGTAFWQSPARHNDRNENRP